MPTKKKANSRTPARDAVSAKSLNHQKKRLEKAQIKETKAEDLITSSVRKTKSARVLANENGGSEASDLNAKYRLLQDETHNVVCGPGSDTVTGGSLTPEERNCEVAHSESETIFSPAFHLSRNVGDGENGDTIDGCLSSEVPAIYFIANSKLECLDECGQDSISMETEPCMAEDEYDDFDDFDPYLFIKNLPELSAVVPRFRPVLLPKKTRRCPPTTLVLDLDETLVHSSLEPCLDVDFTFSVNFNEKDHTVYVRCRPHLHDFMERVAGFFEIIIFTASQSIYAERLLNVLDPKRRIFRHRIYRESCVFVDGNYIKDLSVLGRDLARVIIVDNSPQAFGFQVDNGIPIQSWFEDRSDNELLQLMPFLESLICVEDVRPMIAERYNLRKKVAAAVYSSRGVDLFETS